MEQLTGQALRDAIHSRGYWEVTISPSNFRQNRIVRFGDLFPILIKSALSLRGWDFPHVDNEEPRQTGNGWIGQDIDWEHFREAWRFSQSGQFVYLGGMSYDWIDRASWKPSKPAHVLALWDTVFRFTEFFEFAARLAMTDAGDNDMYVAVTVGNLQGRTLWGDKPGRTPLRIRKTELPTFEYPRPNPDGTISPVSRDDLVARPQELAVEPALQLFEYFGFSLTPEYIREMQQELR